MYLPSKLNALLVTLLFWLSLIRLTSCYRSGSPVSSCSDMMPKHGSEAQISPSPYSLTVSEETYLPGQKIQGKAYLFHLYNRLRISIKINMSCLLILSLHNTIIINKYQCY